MTPAQDGEMPAPILTARLALRPYDLDDVEQVHDVLYGDADVMRHLGGAVSRAATREALEAYVAQQEAAGYSFYAVVERETGLIAGEAGLFPLGGEGPEVELGYVLGRAWQGRGFAVEAGHALLAEAFGPLALARVVAVTREANDRSRAVLARLGFEQRGRRHVWGAKQLFFVRER